MFSVPFLRAEGIVPEFHAVFGEARLIHRLAETRSHLEELEAELHQVKSELRLERAHRVTLLGICCPLKIVEILGKNNVLPESPNGKRIRKHTDKLKIVPPFEPSD